MNRTATGGSDTRRRPGPSYRARVAARALNAGALLLANGGRLVLSALTGLLALTSVALGTYAGFSAETVSPGNTFSLGTVQMTAMAAGTTNTFTFGTVADMVPGESVARLLDITNTGSLAFSYTMHSAAPGSTLDTSGTHGLKLQVLECSVPWQAVDVCTDEVTPLYPSTTNTFTFGDVVPSGGTIGPIGTLAPGSNGVAHLQLRVFLPTTATALANKSSTITFTWTATNT